MHILVEQELEQNKEKLQKRLEHYLECERLLNQLFSQINFCMRNCITQKQSLYVTAYSLITGAVLPGYIGCCITDFYMEDETPTHSLVKKLLIKQRSEKYSHPINTEFIPVMNKPACNYHTKEKGCVLKTHKPAVCVSYLCKSPTDYLKNKFGIVYDKNQMRSDLNLILRDDKPDDVNDKFVNTIQTRIKSWIELTKPT